MSKTKLYNVWAQMRARCSNPHDANFHNYGGRGIKVCDRWQSYENFHSDMAPTYRAGLSLDRTDVNGEYGPANCSWKTQREQMQNLRHNVKIDTPWGFISIGEASRLSGIARDTLRNRVRRGYAPELLFAPPRYEQALA